MPTIVVLYEKGELGTIELKGHFRGIACDPKNDYATLLYDSDKEQLRGVNESQADFVGVDWEPNGESALVAGYDVVWHTGFIGQFIGTELRPLQFENKQVYPVTVAWDPAGKLAAICTAIAQPGMGTGSIRLWNGQEFTMVFESGRYYFSAASWNHHGTLLALASPANRVFNC